MEDRYLSACRTYGTLPFAEVIVMIRFRQEVLSLPPGFNDRDTLALADGCLRLLSETATTTIEGENKREATGKKVNEDTKRVSLAPKGSQQKEVWSHLREISFRRCTVGSASAVLMAEFLSDPRMYPIRRLSFQNQKLGPIGVQAIVGALDTAAPDTCHPTLRDLNLNRCTLGDELGDMLTSFIRRHKFVRHPLIQQTANDNTGKQQQKQITAPSKKKKGEKAQQQIDDEEHDPKKEQQQNALLTTRVDLGHNFIGYNTAKRIEAAEAEARHVITVSLHGNRVLDEVMSAVSHALGCLLCIPGCIILGMQVAAPGTPSGHFWVAWIYLLSLCVLYLGSTLYHSFFALRTTRTIFQAVDHCAIYILIAGSYTPFLGVFHIGPWWLLHAMWSFAIGGILFHLKMPEGAPKVVVELTLYLAMGWTAVLYVGEIAQALGPDGLWLVGIGGFFYTAGVPFFIKNGRTFDIPDHTTWHLFVLAGSFAHYLCMVKYVF